MGRGRAVVLAWIVALSGAATAEAAKVANPGDGFRLSVLTGGLSLGDATFAFDDHRQPECSDGVGNDGGQDDHVDFSADPQCTAYSDDSEVVDGFQPKQPLEMLDGTIDAAGGVRFPAGSVSFPPRFVYVDAILAAGPFVMAVRPSATHDVTGSIDPATGEVALRLRVRFDLDGRPLDSACTIGTSAAPVDLNPLATGTPYDPSTGRAGLLNATYSVPGAQGCGHFALQPNDAVINEEFGLPSPSGANEARFTVSLTPAPQPGVVAAFTHAPTTGAAPLTVQFDAATSSGSALGYQWDFTDDGTFDATGSATSFTYTTPGSYTVRLRVTDADGASDEATASLVVLAPPDTDPPETAVDTGPSGLTPDATPTFTFSADEPSTFECSIDAGTPAFSPCSGPGASHTPASGLAAGTYTFRVRATDAAGNTDQTPAVRRFTVCTGRRSSVAFLLDAVLRPISPALADATATRYCT